MDTGHAPSNFASTLRAVRGGCSKGGGCTYHHRIPTAEDGGVLDTARDVFGSERRASHRHGMGGVGSMLSNCRTLYVRAVEKTLCG